MCFQKLPAFERSTDVYTALEKQLNKPNSKKLYVEYKRIREAFVDRVLPEVTALGSSIDGIFLTDHGPEHIQTVIKKADSLVSGAKIDLNAYEIFLLLISIVIHDVGNAAGRIDHEKKIDDIWSLVFGPLGFDELDKFIAMEIASVHGGDIDKDKDTIRTLATKTEWKGNNVRPRLIAAILRLADEMAEDRHRANAVAIELKTILKRAEAYHYYSYALHSFSVDVEAGELQISLAAKKSHFQRALGKNDETTFLLTEIYERTIKTFYEARYCSRYAEGKISISSVRVKIDILPEQGNRRTRQIGFLIQEHGPPGSAAANNIYQLAPELANYAGSGKRLDSTLLQELLSTE
ncbi:hypothetical protein C8J38_1023 [Rhizobium sp. PP-WC-2G-219]|nr:hypothetical protein C8J38_1023 [Rhizobium sp. PP-WC-2G-219]